MRDLGHRSGQQGSSSKIRNGLSDLGFYRARVQLAARQIGLILNKESMECCQSKKCFFLEATRVEREGPSEVAHRGSLCTEQQGQGCGVLRASTVLTCPFSTLVELLSLAVLSPSMKVRPIAERGPRHFVRGSQSVLPQSGRAESVCVRTRVCEGGVFWNPHLNCSGI